MEPLRAFLEPLQAFLEPLQVFLEPLQTFFGAAASILGATASILGAAASIFGAGASNLGATASILGAAARILGAAASIHPRMLFRKFEKSAPSKIENLIEYSIFFYDMVNRPTSRDLNPIFDTDFQGALDGTSFRFVYMVSE